jgi:PhnB protein
MAEQNGVAIVPLLCATDAAGAIEFYKAAFGAKEVARVTEGDTVVQAELEVGGATFRVCDEWPGVFAPRTLGGTAVNLCLHVDDVDAVVKDAVAAGAVIVRDIDDSAYGTRSGAVVDPEGHRWFVSSVIEELSLEDKVARAADEGDVVTIAG